MNVSEVAKFQRHALASTVAGDQLIPGIHALRGLAAVAVVLFHFAHLSPIAVPELFDFVAADFAKGVYLFFVLSAFSLIHSTERHVNKVGWAKDFFTKRFWRIAPLFYAILALMVAWQMANGTSVDTSRVALNLLFGTAFSPTDGMVPAGWTVSVEMLFYALFPVILLTVRTVRAAVLLAVGATVATVAGRILLFREHGEQANFMLPSNLCFFAYGTLAYRIVQSNSSVVRRFKRVAPIVSLIAIGALLFLPSQHPLREGPALGTVLWGLAFAVICVWQGRLTFRCGNPVLYYLGERSYSIYLMHPLVLWLLRPRFQRLNDAFLPALGEIGAWIACATVLLALLLLLCEITFRLVELPGIQIGRWISMRRRTQSTDGTP